MIHITQEYIDTIVEEVNDFLKDYSVPYIKLFHKQRRVHLYSRKQLKKRGIEKDIRPAQYDSKVGRIYFSLEDLQREIANFSYNTREILKLGTFTPNDIPRLYTSAVVFHENIHKSCKNKKIPSTLNELYNHLVNGLFKRKKFQGTFKNAGLLLEQRISNGRYCQSPSGLNEGVVGWLTAEISSSHFVNLGFFSKEKNSLAFWLCPKC